MRRSIKGLNGAGEWETLQKMLPSFENKRVLDLGCGFGWHCQYAIEKGASKVVGVDISNKMLEVAREKTAKAIEYMHESIDKIDFPVEHPIFTSYGTQDWYRDPDKNILHFPVDNYFYEGKRATLFLGQKVIKYHRTLTTYISSALSNKFEIVEVVESMPSKKLLQNVKGMKDELRRPMMLIVSARKKQ